MIELVLTRLPSALLHGAEPGKTLVIDYHQPLRYVVGGDGALLPHTSLGHMRVLGEADVKFTRYADEYDDLLVDSIDGDSVPIALLHHELTLRKELCPPKVRFSTSRDFVCVSHPLKNMCVCVSPPEKHVCVCVSPPEKHVCVCHPLKKLAKKTDLHLPHEAERPGGGGRQ